MYERKGFTLVELMMVATCIAILMAIFLPQVWHARVRSNETSAIGNLRTVSTAEVGYRVSHNAYGDFEALTTDDGSLTSYLDSSWKQEGVKSGYVMFMDIVSADTFECYADPSVVGKSGVRYFRVDESGVIRADDSERPTRDSAPVGE